MTVIATDNQRVSNVVKYVFTDFPDWCFEAKSVAVVTGMKIGAVVDNATNSALVTQANTANTYGIVTDPTVYDKALTPGNYVLQVMVRGPAVVAAETLSYGADVDTQPEKDAVNAVLAGKLILTSPQI